MFSYSNYQSQNRSILQDQEPFLFHSLRNYKLLKLRITLALKAAFLLAFLMKRSFIFFSCSSKRSSSSSSSSTINILQRYNITLFMFESWNRTIKWCLLYNEIWVIFLLSLRSSSNAKIVCLIGSRRWYHIYNY